MTDEQDKIEPTPERREPAAETPRERREPEAGAEPPSGALPPSPDFIVEHEVPPPLPEEPEREAREGSRLGRALTRLLGFLVIAPLVWILLYAVAPAPGSPLMAIRAIDGAAIVNDWVEIERISPYLIAAVIAAEDTKFCAHSGFDFEAIDDALVHNERGGTVRGASTISQQAAKNAFLWPERSWLRKGLEAYFTFAIEMLWSKRRIMTVYLNLAEWGRGIFGAEAAARHYFGKSAANLSWREAALLAAVLPNPREWRANPAGPYVDERATLLEGRMRAVYGEHLFDCVR